MENATAVPSANARVVQTEIRQAAVARKFLGMLEDIANTTNGMDQRSRGVMVHFTPQPINMNIDNIGCGIDPHPPDMVQNHGTSYYPAFIPAEIFQKRKLLWGQLQQVIASSGFTPHQVKLQITQPADARIHSAESWIYVGDFSILPAVRGARMVS